MEPRCLLTVQYSMRWTLCIKTIEKKIKLKQDTSLLLKRLLLFVYEPLLIILHSTFPFVRQRVNCYEIRQTFVRRFVGGQI